MNWKEGVLNLGEVRENSSQRFSFEAVGDFKIKSIRPGCGGCTKVDPYNAETGFLTGKLKVPTIPVHLRMSPGTQQISKAIFITYQSGESETLFLIAKVIK